MPVIKQKYPTKIQFNLTDKQYETLKKMAESQGVSMAEVMRTLIAKEVESKIPTQNTTA